jgi:GntR family transcriptional repressor for pyruvate dehydrogenase complex
MSHITQSAAPADGRDETARRVVPLSSLRAVQPTYLYHEVARELARHITEHNMQPGDTLPSERELCIQLSASRPSLREALRMLEMVGLVQTRRGGRAVVGSFDLKLLTEWIGRSIPRSNENMHGLLGVRDLLEVRAAELSAERITDEQLAEIEENLRVTAEKVSRGEDVLDEDTLFHDVIFRSCGNAVLQRLGDVIAGLVIDLRHEVLAGAGGGERMVETHRRVANALAARDPEAAAEAMRAHMRSVTALAEKLLGPSEAGAGRPAAAAGRPSS